MSRTKHPGLYDKDAGFFKRLITQHKPRPTAPYPWENTGRVFTVDGAAAWVTDLALAKIGTLVYFVYFFGERPTVCGKVIYLGDRIRLVELPQGHTVDRQAYVTLDRPAGYVAPSLK